MERLDSNGNGTGEMMPWAYDLDLDAFLQIIGVNTYEQDPDGSGTSDAILNNLNNIIGRRATDQTIDLESTIEAAISQSSRKFDVPIIDRKGQTTSRTEKLNFVYEGLLRHNLNYGGLNQSGFGNTEKGTTF